MNNNDDLRFESTVIADSSTQENYQPYVPQQNDQPQEINQQDIPQQPIYIQQDYSQQPAYPQQPYQAYQPQQWAPAPQKEPFNFDKFFNLVDHTADYDPRDIADNRTIAGISGFSFLFFLPLVMCSNSYFGKFHANNNLILLIASTVIGIITGIIGHLTIPTALYVFGYILCFLLPLPVLGLSILSIVNGFSGKAKDLPLISKIKIIK
ncbi:MAG: hypothetical protein J6L81_09505 [Clostridia bacterium]|nr:hypothetical protein [Clostridia bacterium]